jgi:hypothetical protein
MKREESELTKAPIDPDHCLTAQELQKRRSFSAALPVPKALSLHSPPCAQAIEAKKERESKGKQQQGGKGVKDRVGPQQEKGIWLTLVDHLQRQDKLPVVAFTLSRNRCDQVSVVPLKIFAAFLFLLAVGCGACASEI